MAKQQPTPEISATVAAILSTAATDPQVNWTKVVEQLPSTKEEEQDYYWTIEPSALRKSDTYIMG